MILMDKGLCVSPTLLIKYRLAQCNLLTLKVFYFILSESKATADKQHISLWKIAVYCNYNQSKRGDLYRSIRKIVTFNTHFLALNAFTEPDNIKCFKSLEIVSIEDSPHIEFTFDKAFLNFCSADTPTFDIEQIRPMKSKYSILYYKWIEAHRSLNKMMVFNHTINELKLILDLYNTNTGRYSYNQFSDFKRTALNKLIKEINTLTDYTIRMYVKNRRAIKDIKFLVTKD